MRSMALPKTKQSYARILCLMVSIFFGGSDARGEGFMGHLSPAWYPAARDALHATVRELTKTAQHTYSASLDRARIRAIIVPHAAYRYSGTVASGVYRLLDKKNINKVIILAPDHHAVGHGVSTLSAAWYQTPLGKCRIDTSTVQTLLQHNLFQENKAVFSSEHSLELQLPMIQTFLANNIKLIPLIVGRITNDEAHQVAKILASVIDGHTLVIVSTDFTHYGKSFRFTPFFRHIPQRIRQLDSQVLESIERGNLNRFTTCIQKTHATVCGEYPLKILLALIECGALGNVEPRLIAYDTSGAQEKNDAHSVSYVGMLFTNEKLTQRPFDERLTQQEKRALVQEAREVVDTLFDPTVDEQLVYPLKSFGVRQAYGAFTTLEKITKEGKELRGCIGRVQPSEPLYAIVARVTREAALGDARFMPVQKNELPDIRLNLSILSPLQPVADYRAIVLHKHGVVLDCEGHSAVFLPEVAREFGWNREQLLTHLAKKAGLPADAWRLGAAQYSVFTTMHLE